jgi:hypothetical protein
MWTKEQWREYRNKYMRKYRQKFSQKIYQAKYQKWWKKHHKELLSRYSNEWRKEHKKYYLELTKEWQKENPEQYKTTQIFNRAVLQGKIRRQPCQKCGAEKTDGHHEDYNNPLDVMWLCHKCHINYHHQKEWVLL